MAISTGGILTYGRKGPVRSRNIALVSVATIATGTLLMFRYGMFRSKQLTTAPAEHRTMHGEDDPTLQTDQATAKAARGPKRWFNFGKE
ncbi:hypothetical protein DTO271G3_3915 [Paecilomyces variotii]|nr:hypothetical protein DTO271G3_3915 [Paecilomyces variotii]